MISLSVLGSAASASAYYSQDNYYTRDEAHDSSAWHGLAAEGLGLTGKVDEKTFAAVLEGKLPNGHAIATPHGVHRAGLDITFSASKSVSLLALLGDDKRISLAMAQSVKATLGWVEKNLIEARVWDKAEGRQVTENTGKLLAATFLHDINRNGEPQLHIHSVIANATLASDGKWHAVRNDELYNAQHVISAIQNADLRGRLEKLGYETVPARNPIDGAFEIKGVSREIVEAFSTRSADIKAALDAEGRSSPRERELAALATRRGKELELDPAQRVAEWRETAKAVGFEPAPLIAAALERSGRDQTIWSRLMQGVRGIGAKGMALVAHMGLTPRDGDPLVPERFGRLSPEGYAAAQAVASAGRELGEREAAFSRHDMIRTSLERYGPFTVETIEARIDHLVQSGALISGERMLTTEQALRLENRIIALAQAGQGKAEPLADSTGLAARLQESARDLGLYRLNPGQEQAGVDILTSRDRVHLIQGGSGVGKSAALAPVAAIARKEGRNVIALAHVGGIAREFGQKTGAPASTVNGFLGKYAKVLGGSASPDKVNAALAELRGTVILVDEASQIGSDRQAQLIDLSNMMHVGRLVLAGDIRQLPAIDAGKPFSQLQDEKLATSLVTENLRAKSPQMQQLNQRLEKGDIGGVFRILEPATQSVAPGDIARTAANQWASLPAKQRDTTLLLASGRAMRSAGNAAAQAALRERGEIGAHGINLVVLDRVTITREGARQIKGYQQDRIVEFATNLTSQGFDRGERGRVIGVENGKVELLMPDGELRRFDPARLPRNLKSDAVTLFQEKEIALHQGDRIRWTAKDAERGLFNGDLARVEQVTKDSVSVTTRGGQSHDLPRHDPILERLDLAYAINVHVAQGMTATDGIIMMSAHEKQLNSAQAFLVAVTRIAENATLVTDDARRVEQQVEHNPGGKTAARDVAPDKTPLRDTEDRKPPELELGRSRDMGLSL
jgi:conjugative relaxase-like TrwC/TraI family protein